MLSKIKNLFTGKNQEKSQEQMDSLQQKMDEPTIQTRTIKKKSLEKRATMFHDSVEEYLEFRKEQDIQRGIDNDQERYF